MNPAKAITRAPVPDLCRLRAETPAAPRNIALIGISDITLTGPGGLVQLAAIRSFIAARLERAPVLRRVLLLTRPGLGRLAWIDAQHAAGWRPEPLPAALEVVTGNLRTRLRAIRRSRPAVLPH